MVDVERGGVDVASGGVVLGPPGLLGDVSTCECGILTFLTRGLGELYVCTTQATSPGRR